MHKKIASFMQLHYLIIGLFIVMGIILIGEYVKQDTRDNIITSNLDSIFQLEFNQTASIESENLKVRFLNVTEESRCSSDVVCVWEGQIIIVINIFKDNKNLGEFNLVSRAAHEDLAIKDFGGYSVKLIKVEPYPKTISPIKTSDYTATLIVSKV